MGTKVYCEESHSTHLLFLFSPSLSKDIKSANCQSVKNSLISRFCCHSPYFTVNPRCFVVQCLKKSTRWQSLGVTNLADYPKCGKKATKRSCRCLTGWLWAHIGVCVTSSISQPACYEKNFFTSQIVELRNQNTLFFCQMLT